MTISSSSRIQRVFKYLSLSTLALITLPNVSARADVGDGISALIDNLYNQLGPVVNSLAILAIGVGSLVFITAGGNIDKRTIGKRVFFGALGGILIFNIAPGIVEWASANLNVTF